MLHDSRTPLSPRRRLVVVLLLVLAAADFSAITTAVATALASAAPDPADAIAITEPVIVTPPSVSIVPIVPPEPQLQAPPADRAIGC